MSYPAETAYRSRLAAQPDFMTEALDSVIPPNYSHDDEATDLARALCFAPAQYGDGALPAFAESTSCMLDHGVRQVALMGIVLHNPRIQGALPEWLDQKLLLQGMLVADCGLALVPPEEVEIVHTYGPRYMHTYTGHPEFGYRMAAAQGLAHPTRQVIAGIIGRHHIIQARNAYGLEWYEMPEVNQHYVNTTQVDAMVAIMKPVDYIDDTVDTAMSEILRQKPRTYKEIVAGCADRFSATFGNTLVNNLSLVADDSFHPALPGMVADTACDVLLGDGELADHYRSLRPEPAYQ